MVSQGVWDPAERMPEAFLSPIGRGTLRSTKIVSRRYRNRRIGEFFKELDMTEGRCTGVPTIHAAMKRNGSPRAKFKTDELRLWFRVEFPIHPAFAEEAAAKAATKVEAQVDQNEAQVGQIEAQDEAQVNQDEAQVNQVEAQVEAQVELQPWHIELLRACTRGEQSGKELFVAAGYSSRTGNFKKGLQRLIDAGFLELTIPAKPNSRLQKYRLTSKGNAVLG